MAECEKLHDRGFSIEYSLAESIPAVYGARIQKWPLRNRPAALLFRRIDGAGRMTISAQSMSKMSECPVMTAYAVSGRIFRRL